MTALSAEALLLDRDLTMRVDGRILEEPGGGEALIEVEWAGLCGSDLHVMRTGDWVVDWPATPGHEIYGRVAASAPASGLTIGTPVVVDSRVPCGGCEQCQQDPDRCPDIQFVGELRPGGFASHCVLPLALLHPVPEDLSGSTAVLAEPLAVALHTLGHLRHEPRRAAILGHGPIGALIHAELLRRWPECRVDVAEPAGLRRQLAQALGARAFPTDAKLCAGGYDAVIDAAGHRGSLTRAIALADTGAHVLVVALGHDEVALWPRGLVERRLHISGCHAFVDELPAAVGLLAREGWRYEPVITDAVELRDLPVAAARQLAAPDAIKLLVRTSAR